MIKFIIFHLSFVIQRLCRAKVEKKGLEPFGEPSLKTLVSLILKTVAAVQEERGEQINFTFEAMDAAKTALARLRDGYLKHKEGSTEIEDSVIADYENKFLEAINDDLNMPVAMSVVWEVVKNPNKSKKLAELIEKFDTVMGFDLKNYEPEVQALPEEIQNLVNERNDARANKNWAESDRIRDLLIAKGYAVKDSKEGTIVEKN